MVSNLSPLLPSSLKNTSGLWALPTVFVDMRRLPLNLAQWHELKLGLHGAIGEGWAATALTTDEAHALNAHHAIERPLLPEPACLWPLNPQWKLSNFSRGGSKNPANGFKCLLEIRLYAQTQWSRRTAGFNPCQPHHHNLRKFFPCIAAFKK